MDTFNLMKFVAPLLPVVWNAPGTKKGLVAKGETGSGILRSVLTYSMFCVSWNRSGKARISHNR